MPVAASANRLKLNSTMPSGKAPAGDRSGAAARLAALRQRRSPRSAPPRGPCRRARRCAAVRPLADRRRDAPPARRRSPRRARPARRSPARSGSSSSRSRLAQQPLGRAPASARRPPPRRIRARPARGRPRPSRAGAPDRRRARRSPRPAPSTSSGGTSRPVSPVPHDLAAARHVGGDDRPGAGGRLEQRLRHALAIGRRQHRDRGAAPDLAHILDPAEPFDPRLGGERRAAPPRSSESRLSGSVGPASSSSIARPRGAQPADRRDRVEHALAAQHPRDQRDRDGPARGGSGSGAKCAVSTPEPRISAIRAGSMPSRGQRGAVLRVLHDDPARRRRQPQRPAAAPVGRAGSGRRGRSPAPSPITADDPRRRARRAETPAAPRRRRTAPASARHDGRCRAARARYSAAIVGQRAAGRRQRRRRAAASAAGTARNPSPRIRSPCSRTRVATTTSNPASRAARATGRRCDQKYQSSVTRKSSFGRAARGGAIGGKAADGGCVMHGRAARGLTHALG